MGQPRLRLINKEAGDHDDATPPVTPGTPATPSRSKRSRKSDAHVDAAQTPGAGGSSVDSVYEKEKEECLRLYEAIKKMEKDGEPMCIAFNKLPPKKDYPDYYVEIRRPIALDIIKGRITRGITKRVVDFVADVDLMCRNAQQYNMPGSYIHEIAGEIRTNVHELAAPHLANNEAISAAAPAAAAATSSTTPQIKLKFREPTEEQSGSTSGPVSPTPKRKRAKEAVAKGSGEGENAPASDVEVDMTEGGSDIDDLFHAIYDADLTTALKILETPGLPLNAYRRVVLKEQEAESDTNEDYAWAPMHAAACYGRLKVAQVLCEKGANKELVDTMHRSTPLAWAAYTGRKRLAKCLVRAHKASTNARNIHDQLPIEIVPDPTNPKWAEFLMPTDGSKVDLPPPDERSASPESKKTPAKKSRAQNSNGPSSQLQSPSVPAVQALAGVQPVVPPPMMTLGTPGSLVPGPLPVQQSPTPSTVSAPGPSIPQCIGGIGHQETVHPQMAEAMKEIVSHILDFKDEDDSRLAEVFEDLPDREEYPEYYEVILHPMALNLVKLRISAGYRSFDAFNFDMLWIFNNATFFNESDSQIYQDAVALEKEYKRVCREVIKKHGIPFDTSYNDAVPPEGRYVSRITAGENDMFVGDFIYIKSGTEMRIAMITRLRVGGTYDNRKFIDGRWLLKPSEIPEMAGQAVYPHQLFVGPAFDTLGVRGISGKCFAMIPTVYSRVYPQGYAPQDIFVCESIYEKSETPGQPSVLKPIGNWAHCFKTPLMRPPTFVSYITPFIPTKRPFELWNNVSLLPHVGLTMLNRDAVRLHEQNQSRARGQIPLQPQQQQAARPSIQSPVPLSGSMPMQMPISMPLQMQSPGGAAAQMRPPSMLPPNAQNNPQQVYQSLTAQHQKTLANLQAQHAQQENTVRKRVNDQVFMLQQQNPGFIGSPQHQELMRQQSQLIDNNQKQYFNQVRQQQQMYNQNVHALNMSMQQQQQQQSRMQTMGMMQHPISPMMGTPQSLGGMTHIPGSPGINQMMMSSPTARPAQVSMAAPMSPLGGMPANMLQGQMSSMQLGAVSSPQPGMVRPGASMAPPFNLQVSGAGISQPFDISQVNALGSLQMVNGGQLPGVDRPFTPGQATNGVNVSAPAGVSSPIPSGANAHAMMTMLIQQQQQQQQQQQNGIGGLKQTATPLSPEVGVSPNGVHPAGPNGNAVNSPTPSQAPAVNPAQTQQALEAWKKSTQVFTTHGNARITKELGIQVAASDSSMFLHIALNDVDCNHAISVPRSASSIILRPIPGPFSAGNKTLLILSANGRRHLPRVICEKNINGSTQTSDNGMSESSPSLTGDENDKEDWATTSALIKSANYAYEVPLQVGMNSVDIEVLVSEWKPDTFLAEGPDQQVPPAQTPDSANHTQISRHYLIFVTRI
ncbi:hypothetical protein LPJ53_000690 [Coemansia erecta]|uniref:Uncharacterized protein n=1 Tax=Coemansia erecta TaxID=147472 RepID=A0A9W8CVQ1_9FUNG|nr:hypothetical protein LPJ53_000690 [Coemansia erecta]